MLLGGFKPSTRSLIFNLALSLERKQAWQQSLIILGSYILKEFSKGTRWALSLPGPFTSLLSPAVEWPTLDRISSLNGIPATRMGLLGLLGLLLKACWFEKGFDMIWPTQTGGSKFNLQMNQWRFESCLQTDNSRHRNQERPYTIQQSLKDIPSSNGAVRFCNPSLHNVCSCSRDNPSSNAPPMGYPAHHDRFLAFVPFSITTLFFIVPFQMLTSARAFAKSSLSAWAGLKQAAPGFHRLLG